MFQTMPSMNVVITLDKEAFKISLLLLISMLLTDLMLIRLSWMYQMYISWISYIIFYTNVIAIIFFRRQRVWHRMYLNFLACVIHSQRQRWRHFQRLRQRFYRRRTSPSSCHARPACSWRSTHPERWGSPYIRATLLPSLSASASSFLYVTSPCPNSDQCKVRTAERK